MSDKAVITCALNGVLTDPRQHSVPVTPAEMAAEARRAYDAGASVMHIHLRQQVSQSRQWPDVYEAGQAHPACIDQTEHRLHNLTSPSHAR